MKSATLPDRTTAWRAVQQRDGSYDGRFVYGVSSTHIFCRPSCSSRRPSKENVTFFGTTTDAERAGYRPCKRCRPTSNEKSAIERAVSRAAAYLVHHIEERVTLPTLAREVGVSAFHLQREFKRAMGVSPFQFRNAERQRRFAERLRMGDTVSRATYEAGYGSSSRVYERSRNALGMTPADVRRAGAGLRIHYAIVSSPLGRLIGAYTEKGVCWVAIGDDDRKLEREFRAAFAEADVQPAGSAIHEWVEAIVRSLEGVGSASSVPLDAQGTAFQWRVWNALQRIPRGTTLSYSDVAKQIGQPSAVRAVARACATNPVALVVPCHRVVREDGDLGGYRWGLERKEELLRRERA